MNLLCLWHLLFRDNDFLGMQLLPDTKDCARFLVTVDKSTLNLRFFCQVICSAQVFSCLLIVQMRLNQPEQLWFALRCPFPQVQEYHRFLTRIRNCRLHDCFILSAASRKDGQNIARKMFLNSGCHYRNTSLSLVEGIVSESDCHANEGNRSTEGRCEGFSDQIRCPSYQTKKRGEN